MAIDEGQETLVLTKSDRTIAVEMTVDAEGQVRLLFQRERVWRNASNVIVHRALLPAVTRAQSQIATKSYTAGGVTRTGNQILLLVDKMSDDERLVDIG